MKLTKKRYADILWITIALALFIALIALNPPDRVDPLRRPPPPPGWTDDENDRVWDTVSIGKFLRISIPDDAIRLTIRGRKAFRGRGRAMGLPRLSFSFQASPETATKFVTTFCEGILHPGYNPLVAKDRIFPAPDRVLIRGFRSIYYSYSPDVSNKVLGNRCGRLEKRIEMRDARINYRRWIEEIVLDTSRPNEYIVHYNLPYEANETPVEYSGLQPIGLAHMEYPLARAFRLNVTGLWNTGPPKPKRSPFPVNPFFVVAYHTVCIETAWVNYDYFALSSNHYIMQPYLNSDVDIYINDVPQIPAYMDGWTLAPRRRPDGSFNDEPDLWEYCLDAAQWEPGPHTMRLVVTPPEGDKQETFEFDFYVKDES